MITIENLTKKFGEVIAVEGLTFQVEEGEVFGFLGPNGAGKTTAINALMGFLFPESGVVRVLGYEPGDVRAKRDIGFLPENFAFHKYLTAEKVLRLHLALAGPEKDAGSRTGETLGESTLRKV